MRILLVLLPVVLSTKFESDPANLEYNGYVYKYNRIPFKNRNYASYWLGYDTALVQTPLLAAAKPVKPGHPVALPTIAPFVVHWDNLQNTHINDENWWNFEKRIDSKVWWPSRK